MSAWALVVTDPYCCRVVAPDVAPGSITGYSHQACSSLPLSLQFCLYLFLLMIPRVSECLELPQEWSQDYYIPRVHYGTGQESSQAWSAPQRPVRCQTGGHLKPASCPGPVVLVQWLSGSFLAQVYPSHLTRWLSVLGSLLPRDCRPGQGSSSLQLALHAGSASRPAWHQTDGHLRLICFQGLLGY